MLPGGRRRALLTGTVAVWWGSARRQRLMTPQSRRASAAATDLIGYRGYLDRVEPRQRRHPSDNTDEPAQRGWPGRWPIRAGRWRGGVSGDPGAALRWPRCFEEAEQRPGCNRDLAIFGQPRPSQVGAVGHDYADLVVRPAHRAASIIGGPPLTPGYYLTRLR